MGLVFSASLCMCNWRIEHGNGDSSVLLRYWHSVDFSFSPQANCLNPWPSELRRFDCQFVLDFWIIFFRAVPSSARTPAVTEPVAGALAIRHWDNCMYTFQGRRHGVGKVGKRPPWKKIGWALPTLEICLTDHFDGPFWWSILTA